ncbi:MAG TPA: M20/M25/M40 family metallo-hydrolase [Labilithrix sp.]|jgi:acetylornithine deacetylase/succinyl-diaminopimelate desuccinylase-like protein
MRRAWLAPFVLVACAHAPSPAPRAVAQPESAEARITRALVHVDAASFRADVERIAGERNARAEGKLADVVAYVEGELARAGFTTRRQRAGADVESTVVAERLAGPEVVAASAHLDTVHGSPGADDDASGLATLLAIARASREVPTHATIRLLAFAREEEGMLGSQRYVDSLAKEDRERIIALYNFDMVAYTAPEQRWPDHADVLAGLRGRALPTKGDFLGAVAVAGRERRGMHALLEARAFASGLHLEALELPPLLLKLAPDLARGDHAPFWEAGVPAIVLGDTAEFRNPHYHAPSDTIATLDFEFAARVARLAAAAVLLAADARAP